MRLMRWLAVGRSLGKLRDDRSRYKMAEQGLLPRFGPAMSGRERTVPSPASGSGADSQVHPAPGTEKGTRTNGVSERNSMMTEPTAATENAAVRSDMAASGDMPTRPEKDPMAAE